MLVSFMVNAGLAESNGKLLLGIWRDSLHVTCGLTACTPGSAPGPIRSVTSMGKLYLYLYWSKRWCILKKFWLLPWQAYFNSAASLGCKQGAARITRQLLRFCNGTDGPTDARQLHRPCLPTAWAAVSVILWHCVVDGPILTWRRLVAKRQLA